VTSLRLLVDAEVGRAVENWLRSAGHGVASVRERDPRMPDPEVLAWAAAEARVVLTMDKDFGELVFRDGAAHAGVLLLRLEDADSAEKVRAVQAIVGSFAHELPGQFCVFQDGQLRIR